MSLRPFPPLSGSLSLLKSCGFWNVSCYRCLKSTGREVGREEHGQGGWQGGGQMLRELPPSSATQSPSPGSPAHFTLSLTPQACQGAVEEKDLISGAHLCHPPYSLPTPTLPAQRPAHSHPPQGARTHGWADSHGSKAHPQIHTACTQTRSHSLSHRRAQRSHRRPKAQGND